MMELLHSKPLSNPREDTVPLRPDRTEPTTRTTDSPATVSSLATCDETRATRLHYQLRCRLPVDHRGRHAWTPELLPVDDVLASA